MNDYQNILEQHQKAERPIKKRIPEFPNYAITKDGKVWSIARKDSRGNKIGGKWLKATPDVFGYLCVDLYKNDTRYHRLMHQLVLKTFIGNRPKGMVCRHLDGNKLNNNLDNLCWGTYSENQHDSVRHKTHVDNRGENCAASKLTEKDIVLIFNVYHDGAYTTKELAQHFGVSQSTVLLIAKRKRWKHLWE